MGDDKNQQKEWAAQANRQTKRDEESASTLTHDELKRKKRIKIAIYVAVFVVFQLIVITAFGMTVMKVKTPKVRLSDIRNLEISTTTSTSSSFDISFITQVRVKNTNFGTYKFENTTATFTYQGTTVGQVVIPKGKAGFKSTKKMDVSVNLDSKALPSTNDLSSDLSSGVLTLSSTAKTKGKVTLMFIMKKNKSADMNCTIAINLSSKTLKDLKCK